MDKLRLIKNFTDSKKIAIVGISNSKNKFGNYIYKKLIKNNYQVFPIHHSMNNYQGNDVYQSVSDLPNDVTSLIINAKPEKSIEILQEAIKKGMQMIWMQQGSENEEIKEIAKTSEAQIIHSECIIMFLEKSGFPHSFHHFIRKKQLKKEGLRVI